MKGKAHAGDFQAQDFAKKKKKKKRKLNESNNKHEDAETVEGEELGCISPVLFEEAAGQGGEGRTKKKKGAKQQALLDNYFVKMQRELSSGAGAASPRKKRKRKGEDSTSELSDVNQDCQEGAADYVYFKKHKKRKEKQPEEHEVRELPPSEEHSTGHKEKSKKKRKKRREGSGQEDPDEAAEALPSPSEQDRGHRGWPAPAGEDGGSDAASAITEVSVELPADFSTPNKASERAKKIPAHVKKAKNSSTSVIGESCSESEMMTPKALASHKKKQKQQNNSFFELAASDEVSVDGEESLDPFMTSVVDLDTARQELEEFIPHVKNISDSSIRKMAGRDLMRFKEFKKLGMAVKFGRFTQKENKQIQKNIEEFLALTGIDSAEKLLFTSRYPEDKDTIHHLKIEHNFCEKISEGIPRPWRLIYYRARKMFDPNNYKGRYTIEEKEQLKKYQALHGNDWKKISELMSRSNLSVAMKYSEIKSAVNYGPWTKEETQKLIKAVKDVMRRKLRTENPSSLSSLEESNGDLWIDREQLHQPLPWTEIETKVGSRYWRQCKQKWNSILTRMLTQGHQLHKGTNGLQSKITLIKRLYETKAEDASEVNWDELSYAIGDVPRRYAQLKFYRLKVSFVPLWKRKTFSEIIDYLYEKKLPELEEKLREERNRCSFDNLAASQQQKAFRLSDIFDPSEESD
ncbi:Transcription termination factor 1 [Lonchura striata]|uniref:Transcription termination factor 1 n=1 Tax=Lonchura striata TaxID=40157 RepID=A0A218V5L5_9PASE|nr:transcription termination factor 1 [Lonchura striata domestica]XP_021399210.1 transcription termination factor 1 [Lonchura striata domestica]XP_021399212.1 transcription termination factor 1 [Lonchura striata domestica]OWK61347.1 Transcription termination factor 1 [Lonchura striata domestica]